LVPGIYELELQKSYGYKNSCAIFVPNLFSFINVRFDKKQRILYKVAKLLELFQTPFRSVNNIHLTLYGFYLYEEDASRQFRVVCLILSFQFKF